MTKEVELKDDEEYEIIPLNPLRKLEKRIEKIESQTTLARDEALIRDILDIMKANQKLVNDVVESNTMLRNSITELTGKMDSVIENMNSFMELLKEATETSLEEDVSHEIGSHIIKPITEKMNDLTSSIKEMVDNIKETNSQLIEGIERLDSRLKRIYATQRKSEFFPQRPVIQRQITQKM